MKRTTLKRRTAGKRRKKTPTPKEGPYIQTKRAKKTPGRTVRTGGTVVMKEKGKKPLAFKKDTLHEDLGVAPGEKIPASKMAAALAGKYGPKVRKRALFAKNVLAKGRQTARKGK